jgi:PAS domain S-box-containing protein
MKAAQLNKMPMSKGNLSSGNGKAVSRLEASRASRAGEMNVSLEEENRQLKQERDLLRALIDNYPDSIYAKDKLARKILANKANLRYSGYKNETEALGKSDKDLFSPEVAAKLLADDQKVLAGEPLIEHEERLVTSSGDVRWMLTTKIPWRDADGNIIGIIGGGRNISKQKEMELKLIAEHNLLRTLIDNLPDGIYAKDAAGRKILANLADLKCFRYKTEAEAIGKTDFDLFPREIAEKFHADDQKVIQGQPVINREEYFPGDNGEKRWLLTSKLPLRDQDGKIVGLVGIGRDITEHKQAEESLARERTLLRTLIDNLPDSIYAKDAAGRKILANPADLKNLRCKTEAEAFGKTDFDLFPRDIAEKFWADDQKVIQGQPVINREEYFLDAEGVKCWLLTSKLPLRDQNGEITGLIGIGRDITDQKEAEDALRESEAKLRQFTTQLERSNRELQDFAYVASHDLQEPLRKIVVFGERLKEQSAEKLDAESRDFLGRMQKAASRMQTLINDLLTFSRVTTKARPFTQVDLAEVAREVVNDLEGRIEQVKGRVEVGTLPVIEAEALQMRQLLQNLIGNALKFRRPEAAPVVKVAAQIITRPSPEGDAEVAKKLCQLTVSDNGIGFDEKYLDRIFNVFQRLHTRNEYEGTGMGLAIARKIVLYHHGDITAKSKPGQGTTFIATFPLTHPKEPSPPGDNHE